MGSVSSIARLVPSLESTVVRMGVMSDRRLQVFHTVAQVLNFTRAAEMLHMTQPAVTHQIRQLEADFNTRLFDRVYNKIALTPAGEQVLDYASRILSLYDDMHESVKLMTGDRSGLLTLGASTTIAEYMLPELLGGFRREFPDVQVRLRVANTDAIVSLVADSSIDLGIVEGEVQKQQLLVENCQMDELVVIMPNDHEWVNKPSIEPKDLTQFPFIQREDGSGTRSVTTTYLQQHGMTEDQLQNSFELGSTEAIKGAVQAGMGISIVSVATIRKEVQLGLLVMKPLSPSLLRPFYFVRQRQQFRLRLMDELFDFARQYCAHS